MSRQRQKEASSAEEPKPAAIAVAATGAVTATSPPAQIKVQQQTCTERPEEEKPRSEGELESANELAPCEEEDKAPPVESMPLGEDKLGMEYLAFIEHQNKDLEAKVETEMEGLRRKAESQNSQLSVLLLSLTSSYRP